MTPRAKRRSLRRLENDKLAKQARFWTRVRSALRLGYDKPINRQAVKDLTK